MRSTHELYDRRHPDARQAGATDAEIAEALLVARLMKVATLNDTAAESLAWLGSEKK